MLKKPIYYLVFFCVMIFVFSTVSSKVAEGETKNLQFIFNKIKIDSTIKYVKELSGETDVVIEGQTQKIASRFHSNQGNTIAEKYIQQKFKDFNIPFYVQDYGNNAKNIIGYKKGTKYPGWKFIICAHFDSYSSNTSNAPGADDNASGVAAVLEAARVLSEYNTEYTVEFALWDEEEIGLKGSTYYAQNAKNNNDTIMGVINLDMVAYDSKNDNQLLINYQQNSMAAIVTTRLASINSDYSIGLKFIMDYSSSLSSDQLSFSNNGYPSVLLIEDKKGGDFNLYYHSPYDKISAFNIPYYEKCLKLAITTLASLSITGETVTKVKAAEIIKNNILISTYPNPFNSTSNINISLPERNRISILAYDQLGREIEKIFEGELESGDYSFKWNPNNRPSGVYNLVLRTNSEKQTTRIIYLK